MIVVTGATGKLGRHVIAGLLQKVPASSIVAAVRDPEKAKDFAAQGVELREADYSRPETLEKAFAGAEKILLISSSDLEHRIAQQRAVVDAAKQAGAKLLAYTSILYADTTPIRLAEDHRETEAYIRKSGIPYVFLRNGWYFENQTATLAPALEHGAIMGASGEGRFAWAARADYADAAVTVLTGNGHENKIYELAGDHAYTRTDLAAEVTKQTGKQVVYKNLSEQAFTNLLAEHGLPRPIAELIADSETAASNGALDSSDGDLRALIGRPTTTLEQAVKTALSS